MKTDLLRRVTAHAVGLLVFLLAVYMVLQVAGLTRLALTLAGGTGLVGLALGIAFREITENFLASIYLSIQKPFEIGDLIVVDDRMGYVQRVTARTTILMTLDGNHVQIPNATVFKNILQNYTSNPNRRVDFVIGIGYDAAITHAQAIALKVLNDHPAVRNDPEPWVLVDGLGPSTVDLRIYFWLDGQQHSWLKVRSAVIRLTKSAFQQAGISLPDESREMVFPEGVPVHMVEKVDGRPSVGPRASQRREGAAVEPQPASSVAEGGLTSEADEIEEQARNSRMPEAGENLLSTSSSQRNGATTVDAAG
jgi:small-conductance mechanosensitive channel